MQATFTKQDELLFERGEHYRLYDAMGARLMDGGVRFTVWAPHAVRVSVIGGFNDWDGRKHPMTLHENSGVWELFIPGIQAGERYKYEIETSSGHNLLKADPFATASELRPGTASIVSEWRGYQWQDDKWLKKRSATSFETAPMVVYELHLGSWRRKEGEFYNYRELAPLVADYCREMGFTHVELLPITEHPLDESWGYQVTGYFAPTARFGTVSDFQYFVDLLHQRGIGIILDWVPSHFPTDDFSLGRFDGTEIYEHEDPKQGFHPHWFTHIFEFGHPKVANFLIANALFWLKEMHIDGLRVDAVASMLYLDYGRDYGEWMPNKFGGNEYLEAVEFFQHLNRIVKEQVPTTLMIAEESTAFPGVTAPITKGGLGFDMKWNMGWMNDTLRYFSTPAETRGYGHSHLTFGQIYYYNEKFMNCLSHDEVVHEKKSIIGKMPNDAFANIRLLYSYMITQPGKKLLFMGGEFGQWAEWNSQKELDWNLLQKEEHRKYQQMVKELNHFYESHPALFAADFDKVGFEWVDFGDSYNSTLSYIRRGGGEELLIIHNFREKELQYFSKRCGNTLLFSTDATCYGGKGTDSQITKSKEGMVLILPPFTTLIFSL